MATYSNIYSVYTDITNPHPDCCDCPFEYPSCSNTHLLYSLYMCKVYKVKHLSQYLSNSNHNQCRGEHRTVSVSRFYPNHAIIKI